MKHLIYMSKIQNRNSCKSMKTTYTSLYRRTPSTKDTQDTPRTPRYQNQVSSEEIRNQHLVVIPKKLLPNALNCFNWFSWLFLWGQEQSPCQRTWSVSLVKREYLVWEAPRLFKRTYFGVFSRLLTGKFQIIEFRLLEKKVMWTTYWL